MGRKIFITACICVSQHVAPCSLSEIKCKVWPWWRNGTYPRRRLPALLDAPRVSVSASARAPIRVGRGVPRLPAYLRFYADSSANPGAHKACSGRPGTGGEAIRVGRAGPGRAGPARPWPPWGHGVRVQLGAAAGIRVAAVAYSSCPRRHHHHHRRRRRRRRQGPVRA